MEHIPDHIRRRLSELGKLSRPLGETRASRIASDVIGLVAGQLRLGGRPERILEIYEARISCEIAEQRAASRTSSRLYSSNGRLSDVLPKFSAADIFVLR